MWTGQGSQIQGSAFESDSRKAPEAAQRADELLPQSKRLKGAKSQSWNDRSDDAKVHPIHRWLQKVP